MATELLNRSLDLIHSKVGTVHTLEFDTTYPTKLNGFVIKIFRATANYSTGDTFSLKLAEDDILTINKVNSFQGQYTVADYFKSGSAVLCVIEVTENRLNGAIRLWDISREYSKNMDAMILDYTCNQDNDADIINGMIAALQTYDGESGDIDDDTYGIHISENMRRATRQLIIKFYGQLGLKFAHPWTNAGENLNDVRSKRLEFIHIVSNNTREITYGNQTTTVQEEDLFTYVLDFENCIIIDDAKSIINSVCSEYGITGDNWGTRAFLVGLAGDSKCSLTIRGLRFCKDYMGIIFVDGKDKLVNIENCTIVTNTFNGKIAPSIYKSYYDNNQEDDILLYIGDDNSDFDEDLDTQSYSKRYRFPMFIDNYSPTSTVNISNTDINPSNDGYSAIPHIIHNSGKMNIDGSNINFYYCIKYYDNNTFTTQSGAIYNEPRLIDDNAVEYTQYTLTDDDLIDPNIFTMRSILGSFNDFTEGTVSTPEEPGYWWKPSFALPTIKRYNSIDHISYWRNINVNLSVAIKPSLTISNSNIKHTRGMFISNLWGTVTIYNSRMELVNGVTKYIPNSHAIGDVYPYYGTALYNRLIDSYGGELDIKDNTLISNGFNIQLIGIACCKEDTVYTGAALSCINNVFYMKHSYQHIRDASVCIKAMSYDPATLGNNFTTTMGNKITVQNCNVSCEYSGNYADLITQSTMSQTESAMYTDFLKMNFRYPNMRYVLAYLLIYTGLFAGQRDYDVRPDSEKKEPNVVYRLTDMAGTNFIYNIGDNYISVANCYTDKIDENVTKSPMFGIYDQSVSKSGKLDITNSDIGAWFNCVSSILLREVYETEAYRSMAFAHDVYVNNTTFTNFMDCSNKDSDAEKSVIIPAAYFETNQYIDINRTKYFGGDVVINTDSESKVVINDSAFNDTKLLFNVYKDPLVIGFNGTSTTYTKHWCIASYNAIRYTTAPNRHNRTSTDNVRINNCEFTGASYTKTKIFPSDVLGNNKYSMGVGPHSDDKFSERSAVNNCPLLINSIKKAIVENSNFNNIGDNIIFLGQQSMISEYYDMFKTFTDPQLGEITLPVRAVPAFNFELELSGNTFKSFIDERDKYNVWCETNINAADELSKIDDHFLASNIFILGDTVDLDAHDNTFLMANVEGGNNILSMTDMMYCRALAPHTQWIIEEGSILYLNSVNSDTPLVNERMKTIRNRMNIKNNEFASIIFGPYISSSGGISISNIQSWLRLAGERYMAASIRSDEDTPVGRTIRAIYRCFNIGIKNCNTVFDLDSNVFTKSRGKNDGAEIIIEGSGDLAKTKKMYKTYGYDSSLVLFDSTKPNDNDVYTGFNLCIESTTEPIGDTDKPHYSVKGVIQNNVIGSLDVQEGSAGTYVPGDDDTVYRLNMQGLILHDNMGGGSKPYPDATTQDFYSSIGENYSKSIESGGITDIDIYCKKYNEKYWDEDAGQFVDRVVDSNRLEADMPEWNPYSCHGYSIITATKKIYR